MRIAGAYTAAVPRASNTARNAISRRLGILDDGGGTLTGATLEDLRLMRATVSSHVQVKAAGGVRTLDALLDVLSVGVTRVGLTATEAILEDFKARKDVHG